MNSSGGEHSSRTPWSSTSGSGDIAPSFNHRFHRTYRRHVSVPNNIPSLALCGGSQNAAISVAINIRQAAVLSS